MRLGIWLTENEEEIKRKMGKRESDIVLSNQ